MSIRPLLCFALLGSTRVLLALAQEPPQAAAAAAAPSGSVHAHARFERAKGTPSLGHVELYEYKAFLTPVGRGTGYSVHLGDPGSARHPYTGCMTLAEVPAGTYTLLTSWSEFYPRGKVVAGVVVQAGQETSLNADQPLDMSAYLSRNEWDPVGATDIFQTFVASGTSITRVSFAKADSSDSGQIEVAVLASNGGPVEAWPVLGPARFAPRRGAGADHWVGWSAGEVPTTPGETYALRLRATNGVSLQPFWASDDTYGSGTGYRGGQTDPVGRDYYVAVFSDSDRTINTVSVRSPGYNHLAGWWERWAQSYTARGTSLAGAALMATLGGADGWRFSVRVHVHEGSPDGPQVGPTKTMPAAFAPFAGVAGVAFGPDEVPTTPGNTYWVVYEPVSGTGFNAYRMNEGDGYAGGTAAYFDGSWKTQTFDLLMNLFEYGSASSECDQPVRPGYWKGEYFPNPNLDGTPTLVKEDGNGFLAFDWGGGGPDRCSIGRDRFSARWTTTRGFEAGTYTFRAVADDGIRVYVDGDLKLDQWRDQAPTEFNVDVPLSAGDHTIRVEYYENGGGAVAQLTWAPVASPCLQPPAASDHWKGEYFANVGLAGSPSLVADEGAGELNLDWGDGGPSRCSIGADRFSARWTRTASFSGGTHRFTITSDDGFRFYVDGELKLDKWIIQPPTTYTVDVSLTAGDHTLRLDYFENDGLAVAKLAWQAIATSLITNGGFDGGLAGWSLWIERGFVSPTVSNGQLHLQSSNHNGGVYQQFSTGGAGTTISVDGSWASDPTAASNQWAEVLVINGPRLPVDGQDVSGSQGDVVLAYKNDTWASPGGWSGAMEQTSPVAQRRTFLAAGPVATLVLKSGNLGSLTTGTRFDDLRVQAISSPPGNRAPMAVVSATPTRGRAPLAVSFDGRGSTDPDGDALSYAWVFGDGSQGTGENTTHTYVRPGTYVATLSVDDGRGGTGQASVELTVEGEQRESKLGVHVVIGGRNGYGPFLGRIRDAGRTLAAVHCVDDFGACREAKCVAVDDINNCRKENYSRTATVGRLTGKEPIINVRKDPVANAVEFYQAVRDQWRGQPWIDYWEAQNEINSDYEWQKLFYLKLMDLVEPDGLKLALFSSSTGTPPLLSDDGGVAYGAIKDTCLRARQGGHILSLHEYGGVPNGSTLRGSQPWHALRYRILYDYLRQHDAVIPLIITECAQNAGYQFPGVEPFMEDFRWYDCELTKDDYVLGATIFTLGNWANANFQDALPALGEHIATRDGSSCSGGGGVSAGSSKGEYFNNTALSGGPVLVREDGRGNIYEVDPLVCPRCGAK